jgi:CheY-like chemotaxis protein
MPSSKLLAIDDDLTAKPILQAALKNRFEITVENSGASALSLACEIRPHVILVDLNMPNIDGYEVLRQIKQNPVTASIPVVCMSGAIDQESRTRAIELGAIGYLQKPLDVKNLAKDLESLLRSLNVVLASTQKTRHFVIGFNATEKYRIMKQDIESSVNAGKAAVVLSLKTGSDFCDSTLNEMIQEGLLCYLQISPTLIAKFPFLQDLSPVIEDIRGFMLGNPGNMHLFFDDPHVVVNLQNPAGAIARLHSLRDALIPEFKEISLYASRDHALASNTILNEIGNLFCQ